MTSSTISGVLDLSAMNAMASDESRMRAFRLLSQPEQGAAIQRLIASGMTEQDVSAATKLSVEQIRLVLSPPPQVVKPTPGTAAQAVKP